MNGTPQTLMALLERAARTDAGFAFVDAHERDFFVPYAELRRRSLQAAEALTALGLARGSVALLVYPTSAEFFDAFFGAMQAGLVPAPVYPPPRLGGGQDYFEHLKGLIDVSGAKLVIASSSLVDRVTKGLGQHRAPLSVVTLPPFPPTTRHEPPTADHRPPDHESEVAGPAGLATQECAFVQFSSGTTGFPKPIRLRHDQVLANVIAIDRLLEPLQRTEPRPLAGVSWLPLYHDMGLVGTGLVAVARAGVMHFIPPELFLAKPAIWLRTLARTRAAISAAPNFAYGYCADRVRDDDLAGVDLSAWRLALNGAEPIDPATLTKFASRFGPFGFRAEAMTPVYGLAEAVLAVTASPVETTPVVTSFARQSLEADQAIPEANGVELVSVGRPLPSYTVVVGETPDRPAPEGTVSTVWISGPSVVGRPPADREHYAGVEPSGGRGEQSAGPEFYDTGDRGFYFERDLYIFGRTKDVVIVRGRKLAPQWIETAAERVEGVRKGCVVAVTSRAPRERLILVAEHTWSRSMNSTDLVEAVGGAVATAVGVRPDDVVIVPPGRLPRTSSGKLRRQMTLAALDAGRLQRPLNAFEWLAARVLRYWVRRTLLRPQMPVGPTAKRLVVPLPHYPDS